jgi:hypothetical protein
MNFNEQIPQVIDSTSPEQWQEDLLAIFNNQPERVEEVRTRLGLSDEEMKIFQDIGNSYHHRFEFVCSKTSDLQEIQNKMKRAIQRLKDFFIRGLYSLKDPHSLETIKRLTGWDDEKIETQQKFCELRETAIKQCEVDFNNKNNKGRLASEDEMNLGFWAEIIEPQIRNALLKLRRKGYNTKQSGFSILGEKQFISLTDQGFKDIKLPDSLLEDYALKGIIISILPKKLLIEYKNLADLKTMTEVWDDIETYVPDQGHRAEEIKYPPSEHFREIQNKLRKKLKIIPNE